MLTFSLQQSTVNIEDKLRHATLPLSPVQLATQNARRQRSISRKHSAPGEDRTHDLQMARVISVIMRLTRYLLRYRGSRSFVVKLSSLYSLLLKKPKKEQKKRRKPALPHSLTPSLPLSLSFSALCKRFIFCRSPVFVLAANLQISAVFQPE